MVLSGIPSQVLETDLGLGKYAQPVTALSDTELHLEFLVARPHHEYGFAQGFKQHPTLVSDERGGFKHHPP